MTDRHPGTATTTPGGAMTLRAATEADVEAVVEVAEAAYRGRGGWTTEEHLVDGNRTDAAEVRGMLSDPAVRLLVAEVDGTVRGCCYTHRESPDAAGVVRAELGLLAVDPRIQARGIGGRLVEAQAELLAGAGADVLMIRVLHSRPELTAWYERHGFVRTGEAVPFAGNADWLKVGGLGMDVLERPLPTA